MYDLSVSVISYQQCVRLPWKKCAYTKNKRKEENFNKSHVLLNM